MVWYQMYALGGFWTFYPLLMSSLFAALRLKCTSFVIYPLLMSSCASHGLHVRENDRYISIYCLLVSTFLLKQSPLWRRIELSREGDLIDLIHCIEK